MTQMYDLHKYNSRCEFYQRFPLLFHAVPLAYNEAFQSGLLAFAPLSRIREQEDPEEGKNLSHENMTFYEYECFVFCLSKTPKILNFRWKGDEKRALYRIDVQRFVNAICHGKIQGGIKAPRNFESNVRYKGEAGYGIFGREVMYGEMPFYPEKYKVCFRKATDYMNEAEVRIGMFPVDRNKQALTSDSNIRLKINPSGCFCRIG